MRGGHCDREKCTRHLVCGEERVKGSWSCIWIIAALALALVRCVHTSLVLTFLNILTAMNGKATLGAEQQTSMNDMTVSLYFVYTTTSAAL
jgi:hypothetical protein